MTSVGDISQYDGSLAPLLRKLGKHVSLTAPEINQLQQLIVSKEEFKKGTEVIALGSHHEDIHIVEEGWAAQEILLEDGQICIIGFLLPGDTTGINSSLTPKSDFAVRALTPLKTVRVVSEKLKEVLAVNPNLTKAFSLVKLGGDAIDRELLVNITAKPAEERIANLLCELVFRANTVQPNDENAMQAPLTQADLGRALGLSAIHVNRVVKRLRQQGYVAVASGKITVLDWPALAEYAGFKSHYLTQYQSEPGHTLSLVATPENAG